MHLSKVVHKNMLRAFYEKNKIHHGYIHTALQKIFQSNILEKCFIQILIVALTFFRCALLVLLNDGGTKRLPPCSHYQKHYTYPTMIKLGTVISHPKSFKKYLNYMMHPWVLLTSTFFHQKLAIFVILGNTDKNCILIHFF